MLWLHFKTIFSFSFYKRLLFASRKQMIWFGVYLFLLSVLIFHFAADHHIEKNLPILLKNFPEITFEKGELVSPKEPVSVSLPQTDFKILFDATRQPPPTQNELVEKGVLMLVSGNKMYMPTSAGVQTQSIPTEATFRTTQDFLAKNQATLEFSLSAVAFMVSLMLVPFMMLFGVCMASAVGLFFKLLKGFFIPRAAIFKWSFFILGPLSILWFVRLWFYIPLFTFAQLILCIIYMQQIFNTLTEEK